MRPPSRILTAARILLGQTQTEVAKHSGMSSRTLYLIEHGAATIVSVEKLMKYYSKCGVVFIQPDDKLAWGIRTDFLLGIYDDERPE